MEGVNFKQCCPQFWFPVADIGKSSTRRFCRGRRWLLRSSESDYDIGVDEMECRVWSVQRGRSIEVKRNWHNVGLGAFGEHSFGIQIKRNQTPVGRIWWLSNFFRISWRSRLNSHKDYSEWMRKDVCQVIPTGEWGNFPITWGGRVFREIWQLFRRVPIEGVEFMTWHSS